MRTLTLFVCLCALVLAGCKSATPGPPVENPTAVADESLRGIESDLNEIDQAVNVPTVPAAVRQTVTTRTASARTRVETAKVAVAQAEKGFVEKNASIAGLAKQVQALKDWKDWTWRVCGVAGIALIVFWLVGKLPLGLGLLPKVGFALASAPFSAGILGVALPLVPWVFGIALTAVVLLYLGETALRARQIAKATGLGFWQCIPAGFLKAISTNLGQDLADLSGSPSAPAIPNPNVP